MRPQDLIINIDAMTKRRAGNRVIALDDDTINHLSEWREIQAKNVPSKYVLSYNGLPTNKSAPRQIIEQHAKLAGVHRIKTHALRHSHASLLISLGENAIIVRDRLGHEDIETTLGTYGHLYPNTNRAVADKLSNLVTLKKDDSIERKLVSNQFIKRNSMAFIYAMSDIHGEIEVFKEMLYVVDLQSMENKLILLGDYIDHKAKDYKMLSYIKDLQEQYENQVIILAGNHEFMLLEDAANKTISFDDKAILRWLKALPYYYETNTQVYVHAGIDEEAEEYWKWGSEDYYFCSKYPHTIGKFYKDIIAGHIGTCTIADDENYHSVFWDGQSHFYIDGTTELSKSIPVLKYDTVSGRYSSFEKMRQSNGSFVWQEYTIKSSKKIIR